MYGVVGNIENDSCPAEVVQTNRKKTKKQKQNEKKIVTLAVDEIAVVK